MRHPVSTHGERASVKVGVVGFAIGPRSPEDAQPGSAEHADGVRVVAAARARLGVDERCPCRGVPGVVGKTGDGAAQAMVAGPAEHDRAMLAGFVGDWSHARFRGENVVGREAFADVAELGEDLGGAPRTFGILSGVNYFFR